MGVLPHHLYAEPAQLDARAMVHASQVISQEIVLPRLLEELLASALEQAGAERGDPMTLEGGRPIVRAAAQLTESGIQVSVFGELLTAPGAELPGLLLTHAQRMRSRSCSMMPPQPSPFSSDPDFASLRVHSVLCIPLVRQADLAGMLYLENNQLAGAFTSERILTLEVLAAQAAISLENARLYQAAQEAVRVRDDFLAIASHELKTPITAMKLQVQSIRRAMSTRADEAHTEDRLVTLLKTFERHVSRLAYLADDMLEVSRLKAGALALALAELDLSSRCRRGGGHPGGSSEGRGLSSGVRVRRDGGGAMGSHPPGAARHQPAPQRHEVRRGLSDHRAHASDRRLRASRGAGSRRRAEIVPIRRASSSGSSKPRQRTIMAGWALASISHVRRSAPTAARSPWRVRSAPAPRSWWIFPWLPGPAGRPAA